MRRMYEELENLRKEKSSAPPPPPAREVPFSDEVLEADLPQHFKYHNVGEYDGMGDPEEHLSRFENAALLHRYSDPIKCRIFLTTLPSSPAMVQSPIGREYKMLSGFQSSVPPSVCQ
ncbi:hypothetical protein F511_06213 [Dorcoceras hygrometricum]|uniref:Uncharacterized protein n=1 Tax=Dorcoceras hygrometricum TaxID=472368 RepID=A0A2Z7D2P7_9LAMI|nr:hypothetical protein F511_06213 [Dorcoceras hygrometricum]